MNFTLESTNNSDTCHQDIYVTDDIRFRITFIVLLLLIMLTSVAGGLFVVYVIWRRNLMQKRIWFYLLMLAISDTGNSVFSIPMMVAATFQEDILDYQASCDVNQFFPVFWGVWSILTIAAITHHKYRIISKPFDTFSKTGAREAIIYMVIALVLSLFLSLAPILGLSRYTHLKGRKWCAIRSDNRIHDIVITGIMGIFGYFVPLCVIIIANVRTYIVIKKQSSLRLRMQRNSAAEIQAERESILRTLFLIVTIFFILWTPLLAYVLIGMVGACAPLLFSHLAQLFQFLQGSVNPFVYYFRHDVFKQELRRIIYWKRQHKISRCSILYHPARNYSNGSLTNTACFIVVEEARPKRMSETLEVRPKRMSETLEVVYEPRKSIDSCPRHFLSNEKSVFSKRTSLNEGKIFDEKSLVFGEKSSAFVKHAKRSNSLYDSNPSSYYINKTLAKQKRRSTVSNCYAS